MWHGALEQHAICMHRQSAQVQVQHRCSSLYDKVMHGPPKFRLDPVSELARTNRGVKPARFGGTGDGANDSA